MISSRKLTTRSIEKDAKDLRNFFSRQQQNNRYNSKTKHSSLDFCGEKALRPRSRWGNLKVQTSAFSTINPSGF